MSHFYVMVIVPECAPTDVEARVAALLAPFNENSDAPEYDKECYCVGSAARGAARLAAESTHPINSLRAQLHLSVGAKAARYHELEFSKRKLTKEEKAEYRALDSERDAVWRALLAPREAVEKVVEDAHPAKGKPDAACEECNGVGTRRTTYNPKSKWDWYVIGGRWAGAIRDIEDDMPEQPNNVH